MLCLYHGRLRMLQLTCSLSVSFIQMLKAFTPVAILLISAMFKLQKLNQRLVLIVLVRALTAITVCLAGELAKEYTQAHG